MNGNECEGQRTNARSKRRWERERRGNGDGDGNGGRDPKTSTRWETDAGEETETRAVVEAGTRTGTGSETGKGEIGVRKGGEEELWCPLHQEINRVEGWALPFRTRHHLCRQEVAPAGSQ